VILSKRSGISFRAFFDSSTAKIWEWTTPGAVHRHHQNVRRPSGKRLHNYGKSPFIVNFLIINGDFPVRFVNVYQRVDENH
jgi:hypothetical protein